MKCAKETADNQVFCEECLEVMKRFPVKPEIHVQLPNRTEPAGKKPAQRKTPLSHKEQILRLRKVVRWLAIILAATLLVLAITISRLVHTVQERDAQGAIGKNYNTVNTDTGGK